MTDGSLTGIFDQNSAPDVEDRDFELMPPGDYEGQIARSEMKDTRSGGKMISLGIELDNNRWLFDNLNIICGNETAQRIAQANLKRIGETNGRHIQHVDDLLQCRVKVKVGVQQPQNGYEARNVVKFYYELKASAPAARAPAAAQAPRGASVRPAPRPQQSAPAQAGGNPWMSRKPQPAPADLDDEIPY